MTKKYYNLITIFITLIAGVILINRIFLAFSYYSELGGSEQIFIYFIQKLSLDIPFYGNPQLPPYNICQYSPLYFIFIDKCSWIFGIKPLSNVHELYVLSRLINICLNIFSSYLLYIFLFKVLNLSQKTAIVFSSISFCMYYVHQYATRPDSLKNLAFLLSFITLYIGCNSKKILYYLVYAVITFVCIFIKQDAFIFIPAGLLFYLVEKDFNGFLVSLIIFLTFLSLCIFIIISHPLYYQNLIAGLNQGISMPYLLKMYFYLLLPRFLFLAALLSCTYKKDNRDFIRKKGIVVMSIVLFFESCLTSLKWGSTPVYFSECFQLFLIIIALNCHERIDSKFGLAGFVILLLPIMLAALVSYESTVGLTKIFDITENEKSYSEYVLCQRVAQNVRAVSKSDNRFDIISFEKPLISQLADRCIFPTYETEFPEYLFCGAIPFPNDNKPRIIFHYSNFRTQYSVDSVNYFITSKEGCDSTFLGVNLIAQKQFSKIGKFAIYNRALSNQHF